jgi:hypothetical protein
MERLDQAICGQVAEKPRNIDISRPAQSVVSIDMAE